MNVMRPEARLATGHLLARHPHIAAAGDAERDLHVRFRGLRHLPVSLD